MKKRTKIWIWVAAVVAVLAIAIAVLITHFDRLLTNMIDAQLREKASSLPDKTFTYKDIDISLMSGTLTVDSLCFITSTPSSTNSHKLSAAPDSIDFRAERIRVSGIRLWHSFRTKRLIFANIRFIEPNLYAQLHHRDKIDAGKPDTVATKDVAAQLSKHINTIGTKRITIDKASVHYRSLDSKLSVATDSLDLVLHDIQYSLTDTLLSYNDSVYELNLNGLRFVSKDGLFATELKQLVTEDAGEILINGLRAHHTTGKMQLSVAKGKVPTTWADARVAEVKISPVNIVRQVKGKNIHIDNVSLSGGNVSILRDVRYRPKQPYPMPQAGIMKIGLPVAVDEILVDIPKFHVEMATADDRIGQLEMEKMNVKINSFSNTANATTGIHAVGGLGNKSQLQLSLNLKNDKACRFDAVMSLSDAKGEILDKFLMPIAGVQLRLNLNSMDCKFKGDSKSSNGEFCMLYDSLKVHIDKDKMPIAMVSKYSNTINLLVGMLIYQNNPHMPGQAAFRCEVSAVRDPMKNFPVYMFGPLIDGTKKTVLRPIVQKNMKKTPNK